MLVTHDKMVMI